MVLMEKYQRTLISNDTDNYNYLTAPYITSSYTSRPKTQYSVEKKLIQFKKLYQSLEVQF